MVMCVLERSEPMWHEACGRLNTPGVTGLDVASVVQTLQGVATLQITSLGVGEGGPGTGSPERK